MTSESRTGPYANSHMHGYDLAGNRTSADGVTATYDDANKFLQTSAAPWNGQSQYDSHGNVVSRVPFQSPSLPSEASLFTWDAFDQLTYTQLYNSPQGPYAYANYEYDGLGRRIYRWSYRDYFYGGEATPYGNMFYIYDGDLLLGAVEAPDNGSFPLKVRAAYTWGAAGLVSERLVDQNRSLWYHFGPQGETRQLTNSAGTVVDSYVYTAYGQTVASTGTDPNPFRYGGQFGYYTDTDLGNGGLILCGARWYSPAIGRWLSRDPIGYEGGPNQYEYGASNPVSFVDPSGLDVVVRSPRANPNLVTIYVPVKFRTPQGYRPREVSAIIRSIETTWTGKFGRFSVRTKVVDMDCPSDLNALEEVNGANINEITIARGRTRSFVDVSFWGQPLYGTWYSGDPRFPWVVAHETGHLMGLKDRYRDVGPNMSIPNPGWAGNIMAERGGSVQERNIRELLDYWRNHLPFDRR